MAASLATDESQNIVGGASGNSNITIGTFDVIGDVKFEIKLGGTSNITTLNNEAERLNIKVNNENSDRLNINTLNQITANGDSQIFKKCQCRAFQSLCW